MVRCSDVNDAFNVRRVAVVCCVPYCVAQVLATRVLLPIVLAPPPIAGYLPLNRGCSLSAARFGLRKADQTYPFHVAYMSSLTTCPLPRP